MMTWFLIESTPSKIVLAKWTRLQQTHRGGSIYSFSVRLNTLQQNWHQFVDF